MMMSHIAFKTVVSILFLISIKLKSTHCQYSTYDTYGAGGVGSRMYGGRPGGYSGGFSQTDVYNYQQTPGGGSIRTEEEISRYPNGERDVMIRKAESEPRIGGYGGYGGYAGTYNNAGYGGYGKRKRRNIIEEGSRDPYDKSSAASFYSG
jgi:hypothetical protein